MRKTQRSLEVGDRIETESGKFGTIMAVKGIFEVVACMEPDGQQKRLYRSMCWHAPPEPIIRSLCESFREAMPRLPVGFTARDFTWRPLEADFEPELVVMLEGGE